MHPILWNRNVLYDYFDVLSIRLICNTDNPDNIFICEYHVDQPTYLSRFEVVGSPARGEGYVVEVVWLITKYDLSPFFQNV